MSIVENQKLWFLRPNIVESPEKDKLEFISEVMQRRIEIAKRRSLFIKNERLDFITPSIMGEVTELLEALILEEGENPITKMKSDSVFAERVKDEFADVFVFCFWFANLLNIDISNELQKFVSGAEDTTTDSDTNFFTLKKIVKNVEHHSTLDSPMNLAAKISLLSGRLFRPIKYLSNDLEENKSEETLVEAVLGNEEKYVEIKELFSKLILHLVMFANLLEIDITEAIENKLVKVQKKYPADLSA